MYNARSYSELGTMLWDITVHTRELMEGYLDATDEDEINEVYISFLNFVLTFVVTTALQYCDLQNLQMIHPNLVWLTDHTEEGASKDGEAARM